MQLICSVIKILKKSPKGLSSRFELAEERITKFMLQHNKYVYTIKQYLLLCNFPDALEIDN